MRATKKADKNFAITNVCFLIGVTLNISNVPFRNSSLKLFMVIAGIKNNIKYGANSKNGSMLAYPASRILDPGRKNRYTLLANKKIPIVMYPSNPLKY